MESRNRTDLIPGRNWFPNVQRRRIGCILRKTLKTVLEVANIRKSNIYVYATAAATRLVGIDGGGDSAARLTPLNMADDLSD
jgi:hypothetical protein